MLNVIMLIVVLLNVVTPSNVPVVAAVGLVLGRRGRPGVNVVKLSFFRNKVAP
jgi:hypothetical protein